MVRCRYDQCRHILRRYSFRFPRARSEDADGDLDLPIQAHETTSSALELRLQNHLTRFIFVDAITGARP